MPRAAKAKPHEHFHKDGSLWARGQMLDDQMDGYWEFFRKDGTMLRSGAFDRGVQTGTWTTYDKGGMPYKTTMMKPAAKDAKVAPKKAPAKKPAKAKTEDSGEAFFAALEHPLKSDIDAVRKTILGVDKSVSDGVKWNSLSFRTTEWFATVNLRERAEVQLVLHLGAKAGKAVAAGAIPDPKGLLDWRGADRAIASLGAGAVLKGNLPALKAILKAWIGYV